jgi:catechol 2,3-dioxygenase-like lactoylglutathione lyase family enzyme
MAIPILRCSDLDRSLAFYTGVLGATLSFRNGNYAGVRWRSDDLRLSSNSGDGAYGSAVYFPVDDVDAVFAGLKSRGWTPRSDRGPLYAGPTDQTWGWRELGVLDPDGNKLCFGSRMV